MNTEQRKAVLRRERHRKRYPRRQEATFTDENDHNPFVLQDCPYCQGTGLFCEEHHTLKGECIADLHECPYCDHTGITGEIERYFDNDTPPIEVIPYQKEWVACPICGKKFCLHDANVWTGYRHTTCGQRLVIIKGNQEL